MRAAAEAYLTAAVSGEYDTAYDLLCERDRREWQPAWIRRPGGGPVHGTASAVPARRGAGGSWRVGVVDEDGGLDAVGEVEFGQ
jgi:hypothetical protein